MLRSIAFGLALCLACVSPARAAGRTELPGDVFVIDPGHGTRYPDGRPLNVGAVGPDGIQERAVTLAVAEDLTALLRRAGARVVLTRSYAMPYRTGTVLRLDNRARAALANRLGATAFVSIHADAALDRGARGTSVFWLRSNSFALARAVRAHLAPLGLGEAAFRVRDLAVTSEARVPAVLVEIGFISNPLQERLLATPAFQRREAHALFDALVQTYGR
jgi:N-acetylmuramoyl-L-alanine amidase